MEEIDLKDIFILFWKKKMLILALVSICLVMSIIKCFVIDKLSFGDEETLYVAETSFVMGYFEKTKSTIVPANDIFTQDPVFTSGKEKLSITDSLVITYDEILKSKNILEKVKENLEFDIDIVSLSKNITLKRSTNSELIKIIVVYEDQNKILDITNKLVEELINYISDVYSIEKITIVDYAYILDEAEISADDSISKMRDAFLENKNNVKILLKNMFIFAFIGLIISSGYILTIEMFDETIKNENEVTDNLKLKVLFKTNKEINLDTDISILNVKLNNYKKILFMDYCNEKENCKMAVNTAKFFAKQNKKVLYINLNENHNLDIDLFAEKGIIDYISSNDKNIENYIIKVANSNLSALYMGNNNSNKNIILEIDEVEELIQKLEKQYDIIIVDSKDMMQDANSLIFAQKIENIVIAIQERKTKINLIDKLQNEIKELNGNLAGCILIEK